MGISRRGILKGAGTAIVYKFVEGGPALRAAGPNDRIAMGFIGVGIRGSSCWSPSGARPASSP